MVSEGHKENPYRETDRHKEGNADRQTGRQIDGYVWAVTCVEGMAQLVSQLI